MSHRVCQAKENLNIGVGVALPAAVQNREITELFSSPFLKKSRIAGNLQFVPIAGR